MTTQNIETVESKAATALVALAVAAVLAGVLGFSFMTEQPMLTRVGILAASGSLDAAHVGPEYFAVLPLMSFGEAFVNGMVMAMTVVYRPQWVMSFDDRLYLRRPEG